MRMPPTRATPTTMDSTLAKVPLPTDRKAGDQLLSIFLFTFRALTILFRNSRANLLKLKSTRKAVVLKKCHNPPFFFNMLPYPAIRVNYATS